MKAARILAVIVLSSISSMAFALPSADDAISVSSQFGIEAARDAAVLNAAGFSQYNP